MISLLALAFFAGIVADRLLQAAALHHQKQHYVMFQGQWISERDYDEILG